MTRSVFACSVEKPKMFARLLLGLFFESCPKAVTDLLVIVLKLLLNLKYLNLNLSLFSTVLKCKSNLKHVLYSHFLLQLPAELQKDCACPVTQSLIPMMDIGKERTLLIQYTNSSLFCSRLTFSATLTYKQGWCYFSFVQNTCVKYRTW